LQCIIAIFLCSQEVVRELLRLCAVMRSAAGGGSGGGGSSSSAGGSNMSRIDSASSFG